MVSEEDDADGASGDLARTYINGANTMEQVEATLADVGGTDPAAGGYRHYALDHLGSVRGLFDGSRAAVAAAEYGPYGAAYAASGAAMPQAFTGKPYDGASRLHYFPYRYYSAAQLRWVTRDPMEMVDGPNVYLYVAASPVNAVDRMGLALSSVDALRWFFCTVLNHYKEDACGVGEFTDAVPQDYGTADFRGCCTCHDKCYTCFYGFNLSALLNNVSCDRRFLICLRAKCRAAYGQRTRSNFVCEGVAVVMYSTVASISIGCTFVPR